MTPPEIMQLAKEAGISVGYPIRPDRDPLFVIASLIEARVREEAAGKADTREAYCAETMKLPGLRLEDVMVWEQRQNEARSIARAIRNP